jgi:hypothetical protein
MMRRLRTDESGQVLVFVLAFVAFLGVFSLAVLNYATTSAKTEVKLRPVRAVKFAADGMMEGAINKFRRDPDPAFCPKPGFYTPASALNGQSIVVDCTRINVTGSDRTVTFTAHCPTTVDSEECPQGQTVLVATVVFRGSTPNVSTTVRNWSAAR